MAFSFTIVLELNGNTRDKSKRSARFPFHYSTIGLLTDLYILICHVRTCTVSLKSYMNYNMLLIRPILTTIPNGCTFLGKSRRPARVSRSSVSSPAPHFAFSNIKYISLLGWHDPNHATTRRHCYRRIRCHQSSLSSLSSLSSSSSSHYASRNNGRRTTTNSNGTSVVFVIVFVVGR